MSMYFSNKHGLPRVFESAACLTVHCHVSNRWTIGQVRGGGRGGGEGGGGGEDEGGNDCS